MAPREQDPNAPLSESERLFLKRLLSNPQEFPPRFKEWMVQELEANPPRLPKSSLVGPNGVLLEASAFISNPDFEIAWNNEAGAKVAEIYTYYDDFAQETDFVHQGRVPLGGNGNVVLALIEGLTGVGTRRAEIEATFNNSLSPKSSVFARVADDAGGADWMATILSSVGASDFAKQIGHQSLASPGALDIANIPQGFKHLLVLGKLRGQGGGPAGTTWMQVNADAGANYQWQTATASGATFAAGSNTDNGWLLTDTMDVATDSQMAPFAVFIPGYSSVDRPAYFSLSWSYVTGAPLGIVRLSGGRWFGGGSAGFESVKRVRIAARSGSTNLDTGSVMTLYGFG